MLTRSQSEHAWTHPVGRRGASPVSVLVMVIVAALIVIGLIFAFGGGGDSAGAADASMSTHTVRRENLLISVTEDGNLESASNIDVKCEIPNGSTILWIVPDGTQVAEGQKIIELDSASIDEQLEAQKGVYEKALAAKIKATEDAAAAEIAVREYAEGTYIQEVQLAESNITLAMEDLRSAQNVLEFTKRMARKGFTTPLQVEADEFAVKRAELQLGTYQTAKKVLENFTREKTLRALQATRDAAQAAARSEEATMTLEKAKLDRLTSYLSKCVITAPQSGMLVYYKERSRFGSSSSTIEEGAPVRERQVIAQIPKLTEMQANVPVHESKVEQLKPGMRAHLKVLEKEFQGTVTSIANQPESKSFFQAAVKEYPTLVRVDGDASGLRPGMTAEVEILIADLRDVLTVPVSAVIPSRGQYHCYVMTPQGPVKRQLLLGMTNDKMVEVKDGVAEGEHVILNPRNLQQESETVGADKADTQKSVDAKEKFGEVKPVDTSASQSAGARQASGSGAAGGGAGGFKPPSFSELDKDGDGKISGAEMPERMSRSDTNGDGSIDRSEYAAMQKRIRERQQNGGGGGGTGNPGGGRPGGPPQ
ncbi:HlyD family efflux transporter periplasmic adaptor subunit [bacterium]|nr:HlyD family efflux transporter periplasmic adaptor subunit [bacterium]